MIGGFVYVAMILDASSRHVVGYAMSRSIDVRLTLAALGAAVADQKPPPGCVHCSDRGSQYAAKAYRDQLATNGLKGSMGRRGNSYDNAKVESFMKTLKVEAVYPMAFETFDDVANHLPRFNLSGTRGPLQSQTSITHSCPFSWSLTNGCKPARMTPFRADTHDGNSDLARL